VLEGAAAVGMAALLAGRLSKPGPIVLIVTGANIDIRQHRRITGDNA
jgi:threonine dehydratase